MRGKAALVVGLATGYVLGTRDGRERYEQIKSQVTKLRDDPQVRAKASQATDLAKEKASQAAGAAKDKASSLRSSDDDTSTDTTTTTTDYAVGEPLGDPLGDPLADPLGDTLDGADDVVVVPPAGGTV